MTVTILKRSTLLLSIIVVFFYASCSNEKGNLYVTPSCDTANVKYNDTIKNIVATTCAVASCHDSGGGAPGDFSIYSELKTKVDEGKVHDKVFVNIAAPMPPTSAPKQLSDCEKLKIKRWLNMGAPNN